MRKIITYLFAFLIIIGCQKKEEQPIIEKEDYYNCSAFFDAGDYSIFCTVNTDLVNVSDSTIDGGGTVCKYIIPPLDPQIEVQTLVQFTSLETSAQAQQYFEAIKLNSDTTALNDSLRFHTDITIEGHEGYISEGNFANYSKVISVRYKNVFVSTIVAYYKDWFPDPPCNYGTNELKNLMSIVLQNM